IPAPLPACLPFSVSSACASRISWRISVDVWRDRSWTRSPSDLSPSPVARRRVEESMRGEYPSCGGVCTRSRGFGEPRDLARGRQPLERLVLDATHPLGREAQPLAGLAERRGLVAVDPISEPDHLLLLLREALERAVHGLLAQADLDLLDGFGRVARQQLAELGVALGPDRPLEARDRAAELARLLELADADLRLLRELLVRRRAPEPGGQLTLRARDLSLALADVHGEPDRPPLVCEAALDRMADPERRVGGELVALSPVELLGGADQPKDPLLDQVEQRQLVALVALRERDDEPEVGVDHALLRLEVAALDPLGQLDLLVRGEQRVPADVAQEQLERVARHGRQVVDRVARPRLRGASAVVRDVDAARLEPVRDRLGLVVGQVLGQLGEVREVDAPMLLAAVDEGVDCGSAHAPSIPVRGVSTRTSAPRRPWASEGTIPSSS